VCCERNCKPKGADDLGYAEATDFEKIARQKIGNNKKNYVFFGCCVFETLAIDVPLLA